VQGCVRATHNQLPLSVYFRPDRTSDRAEVVFELGRIFTQSKPANLDAYRVTIIRGDKTLSVTDVPRHFWFSRWRWQSAQRPVSVKTADLMAKGLLPHYDDRVNGGVPRATRPQTYQIMGLAGIFHAFGAGGERDEIGPVTEQQADYICTGRSSALATLLAQAEAAGTVPWHYRDEHTGAPIDKIRYPAATVYSRDTGQPFIALADTGIAPDSAHQPALGYVPFLLTGDPYHLETLQFQATFNEVEGPGNMKMNIGQVRAHAWNMRTLGEAANVTPDATPKWLLPRGYFRELLNRQRDWLMHTFVQSSETVRTVFRSSTQAFGVYKDGPLEPGTYIAPWQEEFHAFIFGWIVQMGFSDWEPIFRWKIGSTIARTNGKSGWVRARCTPYHMGLRTHEGSPWVRSWAECWELNLPHEKTPVTDPDRLFPGSGGYDVSYPSYTRGALAIAVRLGIAEARPCFEWIDGEVQDIQRRHRGGLAYKWSVAI
jgi:hypothetical protein